MSTFVYPSTPINQSGTITLGGTAQIAIPKNARRKGFGVYNPSTASETLLVSFLGTAGDGTEIILTAGQELEKTEGVIPNSDISVRAATTGHVFVAWEY